MAAPKKYSDELRERATRMAVELRKDPATRNGAIQRVAEQLGIHPESLRGWVKRAEVDEGTRPGTTSADGQRIAQLEKHRVRVGIGCRPEPRPSPPSHGRTRARCRCDSDPTGGHPSSTVSSNTTWESGPCSSAVTEGV